MIRIHTYTHTPLGGSKVKGSIDDNNPPFYCRTSTHACVAMYIITPKLAVIKITMGTSKSIKPSRGGRLKGTRTSPLSYRDVCESGSYPAETKGQQHLDTIPKPGNGSGEEVRT